MARVSGGFLICVGLLWQAGEHVAAADLGGSIITGIDGNPLAVLAAQLNIPLHDINVAGVPLYLEDGRLPDARIDQKVLFFNIYSLAIDPI